MLLHLLATIGPDWLWHPLGQCAGNTHEVLRCKSYNFVSGIGSDISEVTLLGIAFGALHHLECHEHGCHRHGRYVLGGGTRTCWKHHPDGDGKKSRTGHVERLYDAHIERTSTIKRKGAG